MTESIRENSYLERMIVRSIEQGITVDYAQRWRENDLDSTNYLRFMRGDCINTQMKALLPSETVQVHVFNRNSWRVYCVVDKENHVVYFITTEQNFKTLPAKHGTWPHYLKSLHHELNGSYNARQEQICMLEDLYSDDQYEKDFELIFSGIIDDPADWHLYLVTYEASHFEVSNVMLRFLSENFGEIDSRCLTEYLRPDYSLLTAREEKPHSVREETQQPEDGHSLVAMKSDVDLKLKDLLREDQA